MHHSAPAVVPPASSERLPRTEEALAVLLAGAVGLVLGAIAAAYAGAAANAAAHGTDEFRGLGEAIAAFAVCVPLFLIATGVLFWKLPVRLGGAAGAVALVVGITVSQSLLDLGVSWPQVTGNINPVAMGLAYALAAWIFLPGRSPLPGAAVLLVLVVLTSLSSQVRADRYRAQNERSIANAGVPVATTTIPGYHLAWVSTPAATDSDSTDPRRLSVWFRANLPRPASGAPMIHLDTYPRPRYFDPPRSCDPTSDPDANRFPSDERCSVVAKGLWWAPREHEAIVAFEGALVVVRDDSPSATPRDLLLDAARRLRPTTAHELVRNSNPG